MKIDRRRFVAMTGAQAGAMWVGASVIGCSKEPQASTAATPHAAPAAHGGAQARADGDPHQALIAFIGLCAHITNKPVDKMPDKLNVGLIKLEENNPWELPKHVPTLEVPRNRIKSVTKWEPVAVTDDAKRGLAYFSLEGRVLTLDYTAMEGQAGLHVGFKSLPDMTAGAPLCPSNVDPAKKWDNLAWVLDLQEMHPHGTAATLGNYASALSGTVKLRQGFVENDSVPSTLLTPQNIYAWELLKGTNKKRALKETVRYATHPTKLLTLSTDKGEVITLDLTQEHLLLRVCHLPYHLVADSLVDLRAFYALVQQAAWPTSMPKELPIPLEREFCGTGATSDCGCCPSARFVDETLA